MREGRSIFYFSFIESSLCHDLEHVLQIRSSLFPISPLILSIVGAGANSSPVIFWYQRTSELHKPPSNHQNCISTFSTEHSVIMITLEIKN